MNVYISHNYRNHVSAANKARGDVETLMARMGFRNIGLSRTEINSHAVHFSLNLAGIVSATTRLRHGDILFVQYPLSKYFSYLCRMAHMRGAKVVVLIHDLASFRGKHISKYRELARLRRADYIIATNPVMRDELRRLGLENAKGSLDVWDYLTVTNPIPSRVAEGDVRVAYAGTLSQRRNSFLLSWGDVIDGYVVDVYGSGLHVDELRHPEKFFYHGFVADEKLIAGMTSDFGLVWDGDSLDKASGTHGEYLTLNTPHKMSLYIRAKLPVIVWSGSAMAQFVTENGIGFTIDSLSQLSERLAALSPDEIKHMRSNVERMAKRIAAGEFFTSAAGEALKNLGK